MVNLCNCNVGVEVFGILGENFVIILWIVNVEIFSGDIVCFEEGIVIGFGVVWELGVFLGDKIKLILFNGVCMVFGVSLCVVSFDVVYIFMVGCYDIDCMWVYLFFEVV